MYPTEFQLFSRGTLCSFAKATASSKLICLVKSIPVFSLMASVIEIHLNGLEKSIWISPQVTMSLLAIFSAKSLNNPSTQFLISDKSP